MKKLLLFGATLLVAMTMNAQGTFGENDNGQEGSVGIGIEDPRNNVAFLGVKAGGNFSFMGEYKDADLDQKGGIGFEGGAVFGVRFGRYTKGSMAGTGRIALQMEPTFALCNTKAGGETLKLSYFSLPILFKYFITPNLNIEAGPNVCLAMSASPDEVRTDEVRIVTGDLKGHDVKLCIGVNYETASGFYAGARYNHGLSDLAGNFPCKLSVASISVGYKFNIFKF